MWIFAALSLVVAAYALALWRQNRRLRSDEPPVVWSWIPYLGSTLQFAADAYGFVSKQNALTGSSAFTIVLAGERTTFVCDDRLAKELLKKVAMFSFAPVAAEIMESVFGLTSKEALDFDEQFSQQVHRMYREYLLRDSLSPRIDAALDATLDQENEVVGDLYGDFVFRALWDSVVSAVFGNESPLLGARKDFLVLDESFPLLAAGMPLPKAVRARDRLLSLFFEGDYEAGASEFIKRRASMFREVLSDDRRVEASSQLAILWAVVANTAPTAFWALYFLLDNRLKRNKPLITEDDYDSVITEALRLASGSLTVRRAVASDAKLGSFSIRKGDRVAIFPTIRHMNPDVFVDPNTFDHTRHQQEDPPPVTPFGGGISMCPGRIVAATTIKLFLRKVNDKFDITLHDRDNTPAFDISRVGLGVYPPLGKVSATVLRKTKG